MSASRVRRPTVIGPASADPGRPLLEPEPDGIAPHAVPWQDVSVLPDDLTLEITAVYGAGEQLHSARVDESDPHLVAVTLELAWIEPPDGRPRIAVAYPFRTRVALGRPLAGRMAVDGALTSDDDLREEELARVIRWRAELGLPIERDLVQRLVDDERMPDGRLHGREVLSDDEKLWWRQALQDKEAAADFAKGWLAVQDADLDGHGEVTWFDGGHYVQYLATGEAGADEMRAAAEAAGIVRLKVVTVRYPYRELDALHTAVRKRLAAGGVDVRRSGPEVSSNTVRVMVGGGLREVEQARTLAAEVAPPEAVSIVPFD